MWRLRHRLRELEREIAEARASQHELRQRLEFFEQIAAAAGAVPKAPAPPAPLPPALAAAASQVRSRDAPVRVEVEGTEVIAVIGGEGDPQEWWSAIWQLVSAGRDAP
jgi:hypothetical protein